MPAIQTYSGRFVDLEAPAADDLLMVDIAHGLSQICRFGGHTAVPYSVAEHCVLVADVLREVGASIDVQRMGLLHDAAEAYVGDMVQPLRRLLPNHRALEERFLYEIGRKFAGLAWWWWCDPEVHAADLRALVTERRDLLSPAVDAFGHWSAV